ncbi:TPA: hypothetical protein ACX3EF_000844 [Vibrio parahaemolyticus]
MSSRVIVRGMKEKWFLDHFKDMQVYFGGDPRGIPAQDADFIGFYLEAPVSAITHIGVVSHIHRDTDGATFHFKSIIKLDNPVKTVDSHAIRKHEYWTLNDLGIKQIGLIVNDFAIAST